MEAFFLFFLVFFGSAIGTSVKIVNEKNEYLVERLGSYNKKTYPRAEFYGSYFGSGRF